MDLSHFKENGYQVLKGVIPSEDISSLGEFLAAESRTALASIRHEVPCADDPAEVVAFIKRVHDDDQAFRRLSQRTRDIISGHFGVETRLSPRLLAVPRIEALRAVLHEVFPGQGLRMHMPPMARFVLPGNAYAGVPPHQDISYNKHLGEFAVVWVPFCKIDSRCGGVVIHKGSGNLDEQLTEFDRKLWLPAIHDLGLEKVHFELNPGDALLFNSRVIHESKANVSDRVRYSCDFRFFSAATASSKHYLDLSTWKVVEPAAPAP